MGNAALFWHGSSIANALIGAELAASSETSDGVVGNLTKPVVATAWRALADTAWFTADPGVARDVRFLALFGVSLSASATVRLRLSSSAAHAGDVYDSGVVAANPATVLDGRKQCLLILPAVQSARYSKVDLVDAGAGFIDVGYAWLGNWFVPTRNFSWGFSDGVRTSSNKEYSLGGQGYTMRRPKARVKTFELNFLTPAEAKAQGVEISDKAGNHAPFGIVPDPDASDAAREMVVGLLSEITPTAGVALNVRARPFELVELL
jgi:hypothetical protein